MVIPRYFAVQTFSKGYVESSQKYLFVMLMPSHLATLNFISQLASHCPKLVRSNSPEVNVYSYTGHSRQQTDRRPDVIRQIVYEDKEQDRT